MADSLELEMKLNNVDAVNKMLTGIGRDVRDLRGAMNEVGLSTISYFSGQVFASRGSTINGGQRWQRLNDRYAAKKAEDYSGRPVLVRTGKMQSSFRHKATDTSVVIRNTAMYFPYHQSSAPRSVLPRRAMIGVYQGMQDDVTATIGKALSKKIRDRTGR